MLLLPEHKKKLLSEEAPDSDEELISTESKNGYKFNPLFFIAGILWLVFVLLITKHVVYSTPDLTDQNPPFIGIEAWKDLKALSEIGPKVTGTTQNEILAVNYLKKRVKAIISKADAAQNVQLDHQIVDGRFYLAFDPGMTSVYRSIQNVVVRLEGESPKAVLLNCHFDSFMQSPAANDDIANCAVMLEVLSILSRRGVKSRHTVIFLFNGAEETALKGAHGFIAHHEWAKDAKIVINLEAAGSGGRSILFQSGPGNSWLINHYHAVRNPFAQVSSEEVFQSGIIPSDTDFRVFRDFGNLVGLDFAHFVKGYRYHTKYDSIEYLSMGNIQRTGENILELTLSLSNSDDLDNSESFNEKDLAVYFDFLGLVLIYYCHEFGIIINCVVSVASILVSYFGLKYATDQAFSKYILKETVLGLTSILVGFVASVVVCYLNAYFLDKIGHSMSWFRNTFLAQGIYSSLTVWFLIFVYDVFDMVCASKKSPLSLGLKVQARINGINILWAILTIGMTLYGFRSAYLFMVILMFNLISTIFTSLLKLQNSERLWLYIFLVGQVLVTFWACYFETVITEMFIPIVGRSGSASNPDIMIAVILCATTLSAVSYLVPLTQLLRGKSLKYFTIIAIYSISIFLATSTNLGFPYQDDSTGNPVVQRHHLFHTSRTFYDMNGTVRSSDHGILFLEWDRNALKTIKRVASPNEPINVQDICKDEPFCGMPIISTRTINFGMQWVPTFFKPTVLDAAKLDTQNKITLEHDLIKYEFSINSTKLNSMYIRPRENVELVAWSFTEKPIITKDNTYFVSIAAGIPTEPLTFDITLRKNGVASDEPIVDITLVTIRSDRQEDYTEEFKRVVKMFPKWAFPITILADVAAYQF